MNYRRLGRAGLKVSELSLGSWVTFGGQVGDGPTEACMKAAYDAGVNFFDGAEVYAKGQAELAMGRVIKKMGWRREGLVLSTKLFWGGDGPNDNGLSHKHILEGFHASLRRWQVDTLDLCFCHRPDPNTPIEETVRAMDVLIRQGKLFYWGTSEWSAKDLVMAFKIAREQHLTPPTMEQPQYNMLVRERVEQEYAPLFAEFGLGTTIWSPLASGVLTGKYNDGSPADARLSLSNYGWLKETVLKPENLSKAKALGPIAKDLACTQAQLALAWCLKNPNVSTVITGATRAEQVVENMKALDVLPKLNTEVMTRIDGALGNQPR
jgi:voltage-dependent potassium channel beta subunit